MRCRKLSGLACVFVLLAGVSAVADQVDDLLADLVGGDATKQTIAIIYLKRIRDVRVTRAVIIRAADAGTSLSIRMACIDIIRGQKLQEGLDTLLQIARDAQQPYAIRRPALLGLAELSGSTHADLMIKLIREDNSVLVKEVSSVALGKTGDPKIIPKITTLLDKPETARYAIIALAALGDVSAVPHLVARLKTDNRTLRYALIKALGKLRDKRAITPLLELYDKDDNSHQKGLILRAFGKINDPKALSKLSAVAIDRNSPTNIRAMALLSIEELRATEALPTVVAVATTPGENIKLRLDAIRTLGNLGDGAIPPLLLLLEEKGLANDVSLSLSRIMGAFFPGTDIAGWRRFYEDYKKRKRPSQK